TLVPAQGGVPEFCRVQGQMLPEVENRQIKRPFSPPAAPTLASTPRHRERPQRAGARGSPWPRQRRPPGVGQQAGGLPGGQRLLITGQKPPFTWFVTLPNAEAERPGVGTPLEGHQPDRRRCVILRATGRWNHPGRAPAWGDGTS